MLKIVQVASSFFSSSELRCECVVEQKAKNSPSTRVWVFPHSFTWKTRRTNDDDSIAILSDSFPLKFILFFSSSLSHLVAAAGPRFWIYIFIYIPDCSNKPRRRRRRRVDILCMEKYTGERRANTRNMSHTLIQAWTHLGPRASEKRSNNLWLE